MKQAFDYFVSMGWTPVQAAGIVANLFSESRLNPAAVGDGGQAYGIAQWHPDRQAGFAALIGHPIQGSSLEDQLAWVHAELQSTEKRAGDALRGCTTANEAGACVSKLYERPADREGDAAKRGELAESIYAQYQPTAPVAPVATQPEKPMGALAPLFLQTILPAVIGLFAPKVQQQVAKVTGSSPDAAGAFLQQLMGAVSTAANVPVTDQATAIQAVAKVTADPAMVAQVETHALDYLDKLGPMFDKLAAAEAATNAQSVAGMNAASARAQADKWDMTPWLVWFAGGTSTALVIGLLGVIVYQATTGDRTIDTGLVGIAGPLLAISMGVWREIFAYRFDGSKNSETQAVLATAINNASNRASK